MTKGCYGRQGTKRLMPPVDCFVRSAFIESRAMPRVTGCKGDMLMTVDDAMVTIINPGGSELFQRGMCFMVKRTQVRAKRIDVKPTKFCGSNNHHKFLAVAHDVSIDTTFGGASI